MNRNKKPVRTYKILKRVIFITLLLALIEVVVLVVLHFKNDIKSIANIKKGKIEVRKIKEPVLAKTQKKIIEQIAVPIKDTQKIALSQPLPSSTVADNKPKDTIPKKTPPVVAKLLVEPTKPLIIKAAKDTLVKTAAKETLISEPVSSEKMVQILNDVRGETQQVNNFTKCISIQIVDNSNVENASVIANYLRRNGYIISGREIVPGSRKGIQINAEGPCIKLTIGTL